MAIIVQKFGGSSVADVDKIQAVAAKVAATRAEGHDVVVVVSAMGKTTDELLALAHQIDRSPPRRELDMLLSTGERISMALLSMAIQKHGCDAISFTGSQSGIITNDRHVDARIIDVRPHRVEDELARNKVVIIAGFQGMSYKREITTLGRGGSDTTALAMAAALGATHAEIYSDVDGVYSADPRKVDGAVHLPEIGYDEMQQMATAGAKVLHHKAVEFARQAKIAIRARSTFQSGRETVIHAGGRSAGAVVGSESVAWVRMAGAYDATRVAELESFGIGLDDVDAYDDNLSFVVRLGDLPDWENMRDRLRSRFDADIQEGLGRVSFVASDAKRRTGAFLTALQQRPVLFKASSLCLSALLPEAAVADASQRVHDALVSTE